MSYTLDPSDSLRLLHDQRACRPDSSSSLHSKENIELLPIDLGPSCSDSQIHSDTSHHETTARKLSQVRHEKQKTPYARAGRIARNIWLTAFLPIVAFGYLSFCYVVAARVVPVSVYKVDQPLDHLYVIKAGVTTISIIIVTTALLPVKSLLDELKGEEFFRQLHNSQTGVPLEFVNNISTPSYGLFSGIIAVVRAQTSKYYAGTILSGLVAAVITSLAPAALSVGNIPVDGELLAFRMGSVDPDSVYIPGFYGADMNQKFDAIATEAASMGWVQTTLGMDMPFRPLSDKHAVPIPLDLDDNAHARWVSDVITMDPVCNWTIPDPPLVVPPELWNSSVPSGTPMNISLPTYGVGAYVDTGMFGNNFTSAKSLQMVNVNWRISPFNLTTKDPPTQETTVWLMAQCISCKQDGHSDISRIDFTDIPNQKVKFPASNGENVTEVTSLVSVFVCNPRATIESREVRADGTGRIEVVESKPLFRQGNLHTSQTRLLLSQALIKYTSNSGPDTTYSRIGQAAQIQLFFGKVGNASETPVLVPLSVEKITKGYGLAQQAAMRSYLSGELGVSYVPGYVQTMTLAFTSSLPHVIVSTILFAFLTVFINLCYLRTDTEQFTLFSVATALAHSDVPNLCKDIRYADQGRGIVDEDVALKSLRERRICLANKGGPDESLRLD